MCRCAERRALLSRTIDAAAHGDFKPVGSAAAFVTRTSIEDLAQAARRAAARMRLAR